MEWCLPQVLLTPEMCGHPAFILTFGFGIWSGILGFHLIAAAAVIELAGKLAAAPFRRRKP